MKVLVLGGTGNIGNYLVKNLLDHNVAVRVVGRNHAKLKALPEGAEGVVGDLVDPELLDSLFTDIDRVFFLLESDLTELFRGLLTLDAIRKSGVKRIVYLSVYGLEKELHIPQISSKYVLEQAIKNTGIPFTILRPNMFFQNQLKLKDAITKFNILPSPLGSIGLSAVDVRDIAEVATIALTTDNHIGQTIDIVGPDVLTGSQMAKTWSDALGRPITYMGDDLASWEAMLKEHMPAALLRGYVIMNEYFIRNGLVAKPGEVERLTKILGHPPRSFEAFTQELAASWKHLK